jgi:secreted Zn-dependent insulinase-like peptidase
MLDLFVSMASKPAFHSLRTQQRLGYSVHLGASHLQRQLCLVLRVQSPTTTPAAVADAIRAWLSGFRPELQALAADKLDSHKQVGGCGGGGECQGKENVG